MRISKSKPLRAQWPCVLGAFIVICPLFAEVPSPSFETVGGSAGPLVLQIDANKVVAHVSPIHAGIFTEEVGHAMDGGLYGELISNRVFKVPTYPDQNFWMPKYPPRHWSLVNEGTGAGAVELDEIKPLNNVLTTSMRMGVISASAGNRFGVANDGFWGLPVKPATNYHASFYARVEPGSVDQLTVSIEGSGLSAAIFARARVRLIPGPWQRYDVDLATAANISPTVNGRFVISAESSGTIWLNLISLFPKTWGDRPNGVRIDLMQKLKDLHPAFLRFPGGSALEGNTMATHFDWKKTIGPLVERPGNTFEYFTTQGIGLLEYLYLCEDLGVEPVVGVYAGLSFKEPAVHPGLDLQPFVQEALDEIEYITGGVDTTWGSQRALDGHPAPFKLRFLEVGNEDFLFPKSDYEGRFGQFYDAIKAKYPDIQIIATQGIRNRRPDVIDEHYYLRADEFLSDIHHFDLYPRSGPKIFVGEWSTAKIDEWLLHGISDSDPPTSNLAAALADAAWMTGMERNSDVVIMQSYSELLVNVNKGAYNWPINLIGYDALTSYASPSYYVQVMFNNYRGDEVIASSASLPSNFFNSVTRESKTGTIYIKVVNALGSTRRVTIDIHGVDRIEPVGKVVQLAGRLEDTNSIKEPTKIVPAEIAIEGAGEAFDHDFPANSVTVIELRAH
jgi:alpha-N-arabinofuranosidase